MTSVRSFGAAAIGNHEPTHSLNRTGAGWRLCGLSVDSSVIVVSARLAFRSFARPAGAAQLETKKNGDQRRKAYDVFPQLVITDEFMRRVITASMRDMAPTAPSTAPWIEPI